MSARIRTQSATRDLTRAILAQVHEDEIVAMACEVINIPSPTGEELAMGCYMRSAWEEMGLQVTWQEVEEGRANVIGRWQGRGGGKHLMFNGHMDTSNSGRENFLTGIGYKPHAVVREGLIYGLGIYNMKGALVCYTQVVRALEHFGSLWARISTTGNYVHTAFAAGKEEQNSILRMQRVLGAVREWMPRWQEKASYGGKRGIVNVGGIQGGHAWRASRTPERTDLYLDLRVPPHMEMADARREIEQLFLKLRAQHPDWGLEFETYVSVPGATISEDHEMVKAIESHHRRVMGAPAKRDVVTWCSDASVLSRYGIPTVNYGPSSGPRDHEGEKVAIKTLVDITRVYALTAAELCGVR
jgi:acetylornithine deacetylase/succinyl-diaminopimelate desuccinylase-like protein